MAKVTQMAKDFSHNRNALLYVLAIFLPPIPVYMKRGLGTEFWINVLLCVLGWIPGIIHSCYIIKKSDETRNGFQAA